MTTPSPWFAVAARLVELIDSPAAIIDDRGHALRANASFVRLMEWPAGATSRPWTHEVVPGDRQRLEAELRESRSPSPHAKPRKFQARVVTRQGRELQLQLEVRAVGEGPRGTVIVVAAWEVPKSEAQVVEHVYDICTTPTFGTIRRVWTKSDEAHRAGVTCYRWFHGLSGPCAGCPALQRTQPEVGVVPGDPGKNQVSVVTSEPAGPGTFRMRAWSLPARVLGEMFRIRIDQIAANAGLSAREREVVRLIVHGRPVTHIATELGIASRTVKFHQANVLRKLGARSLVDLLRLLL